MKIDDKKLPSPLLKSTLTKDQNSWLWGVSSIALALWSLNWILLSLKDTERGTIGDMFGVFNSLFAGIAFIGVLITIFLQRNQIQLQQLEISNSRRDAEIDGFENKFYKMVDLHRENLKEIEIADATGHRAVRRRKAFVAMFAEFKFIYLTLLTVGNSLRELDSKFTIPGKEHLLDIAYIVFFTGVGPTSNIITNSLLKAYDENFINLFIETLINFKDVYLERDELVIDHEDKSKEPFALNVGYIPFGGHSSRLGHYYRHLYQTVKFVADQDDAIITNKYEYIKTIRAQLSNHEQLMLYYNGLSRFGKAWIEEQLFTDYRMIKNIPLPLAELGVSPIKMFGKKNKKGEFLFEWDQSE